MDKLVDSFGRGENPSPAEPQPRAPTAEEITAEANRIAPNARAEEEANVLARQLANAQAEADAKKAQEIATAARLKAFQDAEADIFNTQSPGGHDQQVPARAVGGGPLQPFVQAILAGVGCTAPATMPVRVHSLPTLPKVGDVGPNGIQTAVPMVEKLRIL